MAVYVIFFKGADLDLDLKVGLDLDLDLNIAGFAHHWLPLTSGAPCA